MFLIKLALALTPSVSIATVGLVAVFGDKIAGKGLLLTFFVGVLLSFVSIYALTDLENSNQKENQNERQTTEGKTRRFT